MLQRRLRRSRSEPEQAAGSGALSAVRAEDRSRWDQWWLGRGQREFHAHLLSVDPLGVRGTVAAERAYDGFVEPLLSALRRFASPSEVEAIVANLRAQHGAPPDSDADGNLAIGLSVWFNSTPWGPRPL